MHNASDPPRPTRAHNHGCGNPRSLSRAGCQQTCCKARSDYQPNSEMPQKTRMPLVPRGPSHPKQGAAHKRCPKRGCQTGGALWGATSATLAPTHHLRAGTWHEHKMITHNKTTSGEQSCAPFWVWVPLVKADVLRWQQPIIPKEGLCAPARGTARAT